AVLDDPNDPVATRILGAGYAWKFMERGRGNLGFFGMMSSGQACIDYLGKAAALDGKNRVLPSIQACARVAEARMRGSVLKIDVEGADTLVLQGARQLLAAHQIDHVFFEVNRVRMERLQIPQHQAPELLAACGYRTEQIAPNEFHAYRGNDELRMMNDE
ncbi:MAG: FkbM family methyltransferase, partial [Saprospiraceae bacterium]